MLLTAKASLIQRQTFYLADYEPLSLRDYTNGLAAALGAGRIPTMPLPMAKMMALAGDGVEQITGQAVPFNSFRLNNILTEYVFDLSTTRAVCGLLPYSFSAGLTETAQWLEGEISSGKSGNA